MVKRDATLRDQLAYDSALLHATRRDGRVAPSLGLVLNVEERLAMTHRIQKLLWHKHSLSWVTPPHHIRLKCAWMGRCALTYKGKQAKRDTRPMGGVLGQKRLHVNVQHPLERAKLHDCAPVNAFQACIGTRNTRVARQSIRIMFQSALRSLRSHHVRAGADCRAHLLR